MEQVGFGDSVVAKLGRLTVCARADGRGMGPKCLFAEQAARLAALDDGGQLVAERPCLLRAAEHAAPLPGRRLELAEELGLSEPLVGHFGGHPGGGGGGREGARRGSFRRGSRGGGSRTYRGCLSSAGPARSCSRARIPRALASGSRC